MLSPFSWTILKILVSTGESQDQNATKKYSTNFLDYHFFQILSFWRVFWKTVHRKVSTTEKSTRLYSKYISKWRMLHLNCWHPVATNTCGRSSSTQVPSFYWSTIQKPRNNFAIQNTVAIFGVVMLETNWRRWWFFWQQILIIDVLNLEQFSPRKEIWPTMK